MMMFGGGDGSDQFIARTGSFSFLALQSQGTGRRSSRVESEVCIADRVVEV
jgi:hypothetical protein